MYRIRLLIVALMSLASINVYAAECIYKAGPPDAERAYVENSTDSGGVSVAWYGGATSVYAHGVLGDAIEAQTLYAQTDDPAAQCAYSVTLGSDSVFEDVIPRIEDVTGDGENNVIVIESHRDKGASLAVYGVKNQRLVKITSTPYIGNRYRWLAPAGIADFNGDSVKDVAYVETPHIGGILKIWSFREEAASLIASKRGFSNHRIGENFITGGLRTCAGKPELVLPDQLWGHTVIAGSSTGANTGTNSDPMSVSVSVYAQSTSEDTIQRALQCR